MKITDIDFAGKIVLVRVDFNVPQDEHLHVTDTTRIEASKTTIDYIIEKGGKVVLMSHLGRPDGKVIDKFSLKYIVDDVSKILGHEILFVNDCKGEIVKNAIRTSNNKIILLENLRFYKEEETGDPFFAKELAALGDIYINDAFGTAHREHASTAVIAHYVKQKAFGFLMQKELDAIEKVLKSGEKPITAIIGGSKVSTKITIIKNLLPSIDNLIVGGGMAFTFVKAKGGSIGQSIVENDKLNLALEIEQEAKNHNVNLYLPIDVYAAKEFKDTSEKVLFNIYAIPNDYQGLDAGEKTIDYFTKIISKSRTILWNGPIGVFEFSNFAHGTCAIGDAIADATKNGAFSLVGGGDSVAFVKQYGYADKVSYVSTGGGAMLESLEGKVLPGVAAILND